MYEPNERGTKLKGRFSVISCFLKSEKREIRLLINENGKEKETQKKRKKKTTQEGKVAE